MSGCAAETALLAQMNRLALPAVRLGCRLIRDGDEALLLPEECGFHKVADRYFSKSRTPISLSTGQ